MKVALIGKGKGWELAPLMGNGIVTWGVNDIVGHREVDVCFYMDMPHLRGTQMEETITKSVNHTKTPLYSVEHFEEIPTSIAYPREEVFSLFGTDFFADSFCYMIALALYQGYRELDIYGFNYAFGEKYHHEKPCVHHWLGVAMGMGCTVSTYGEYCELFKTKDKKVYAYLDDQTFPTEGMQVRGVKPILKEYEFSIDDRMSLLGLLPLEGNYKEMKFTQRFHRDLSFTMEENKKLNIRGVDDTKAGKQTIIYDQTDIPAKVIELNQAEVSMIATWLYGLEQRQGLNLKNLKLYERFCNGNIIHNMDTA